VTAPLVRLLVIAAVGGGAWLLAGWLQRRPGRSQPGLPLGLTLITGPGCRLCGLVERALRRAGVVPRIVDVEFAQLPGYPIRSLPVAVVVDGDGEVVMRRAGRSALDDALKLAARARTLPGAPVPPSVDR
jgi:hypothetical protein